MKRFFHRKKKKKNTAPGRPTATPATANKTPLPQATANASNASVPASNVTAVTTIEPAKTTILPTTVHSTTAEQTTTTTLKPNTAPHPTKEHSKSNSNSKEGQLTIQEPGHYSANAYQATLQPSNRQPVSSQQLPAVKQSEMATGIGQPSEVQPAETQQTNPQQVKSQKQPAMSQSSMSQSQPNSEPVMQQRPTVKQQPMQIVASVQPQIPIQPAASQQTNPQPVTHSRPIVKQPPTQAAASSQTQTPIQPVSPQQTNPQPMMQQGQIVKQSATQQQSTPQQQPTTVQLQQKQQGQTATPPKPATDLSSAQPSATNSKKTGKELGDNNNIKHSWQLLEVFPGRSLNQPLPKEKVATREIYAGDWRYFVFLFPGKRRFNNALAQNFHFFSKKLLCIIFQKKKFYCLSFYVTLDTTLMDRYAKVRYDRSSDDAVDDNDLNVRAANENLNTRAAILGKIKLGKKPKKPKATSATRNQPSK